MIVCVHDHAVFGVQNDDNDADVAIATVRVLLATKVT